MPKTHPPPSFLFIYLSTTAPQSTPPPPQCDATPTASSKRLPPPNPHHTPPSPPSYHQLPHLPNALPTKNLPPVANSSSPTSFPQPKTNKSQHPLDRYLPRPPPDTHRFFHTTNHLLDNKILPNLPRREAILMARSRELE